MSGTFISLWPSDAVWRYVYSKTWLRKWLGAGEARWHLAEAYFTETVLDFLHRKVWKSHIWEYCCITQGSMNSEWRIHASAKLDHHWVTSWLANGNKFLLIFNKIQHFLWREWTWIIRLQNHDHFMSVSWILSLQTVPATRNRMEKLDSCAGWFYTEIVCLTMVKNYILFFLYLYQIHDFIFHFILLFFFFFQFMLTTKQHFVLLEP